MKINIYVDNHGKLEGVEDILGILQNIFRSRGHEVEISRELRADSINIITDEFTNALANRDILAFRGENPSARIVFVLTEFIETKWLVTSFNFFGDVLEAAAIAALNVYIRRIRKDYSSPNIKDWCLAILYVPFLLGFLAKHYISNEVTHRRHRMTLRKRLYRLAYMLMRYLGLKKMITCADCIVLFHDKIAEGVNKMPPAASVVGTIYPEIDADEIKGELFKNKELCVEVTGSITPYRKKFIVKINNEILSLGLKNVMGFCKVSSFASGNSSGSNNGAYSLHPPQAEKWKYCSPTRIYRALQFDHNVPVLTKKFNQHPIEELGLEYMGADSIVELCQHYRNPRLLIASMETAMRNYQMLAKQHNDVVVRAIEDECGSIHNIGK